MTEFSNPFGALAGFKKITVDGSAAEAAAVSSALTSAGAEGVTDEAAATAAINEGAEAERTRILALFDMDSNSKLSPGVRAAIEEGSTVEQFAIGLATSAKARAEAPRGTLAERLGKLRGEGNARA